MSWHNITLDSLLPGAKAAADAAKAAAEAGLSELDPVKAAVLEKMNEAQARVDAAREKLEEFAASGFYCIYLPPGQGLWASRLSSAPNAPVNDPDMYSAAVVTLTVAPGYSSVASAFSELCESATKPITAPKIAPTMPQFSPPQAAEVPAPQPGEWAAVTLADIMPGAFKTAEDVLNTADSTLSTLKNGYSQILQKEQALKAALSAALDMLGKLTTGGFYNSKLNPAKGGWRDRLLTADAPPLDSDYYSAGMAAVVVDASFETVSNLYSKLEAAL